MTCLRTPLFVSKYTGKVSGVYLSKVTIKQQILLCFWLHNAITEGCNYSKKQRESGFSVLCNLAVRNNYRAHRSRAPRVNQVLGINWGRVATEVDKYIQIPGLRQVFSDFVLCVISSNGCFTLSSGDVGVYAFNRKHGRVSKRLLVMSSLF